MEEDKFIVINIKEYLSNNNEELEEELKEIFSEYKCDKNPEVEEFLKENAIEFAKKNQSITYLVFSSEGEYLAGYFTITIKPLILKSENMSLLSNKIKNKIKRISEMDKQNEIYNFSAYLIAQLGKNFNDDIHNKITGTTLLGIAEDAIKDLQYRAGGTIMFLEAEDNEKLMEFYVENNGYKKFDIRTTEKNGKLVQLLKSIR